MLTDFRGTTSLQEREGSKPMVMKVKRKSREKKEREVK